MRDAAVEDVGLGDAAADGAGTGLDLRDHPADDAAGLDELVEDGRGGLADERLRVVRIGPKPLDVGEEDELLRAERLGDDAGDGVGVDVVRLATGIGTDRGEDRDQPLGEQPLEDRRY